MKKSSSTIVPPMTGLPTFQQHYFHLKNAADTFDIPATLDLTTSIVKLSYPNTNLANALIPMFSKLNADKNRYYDGLFEQESDRFAGWKPYLPSPIETFKDKVLFKKRLLQAGCLVPDYSESAKLSLSDVIIKTRTSSFSRGIKGPFRDTSQLTLNTDYGEYFEQFIPGEIAKVWYINAKPICIELSSMPSVTGDGKQTIRELIIALLQSKMVKNIEGLLLQQVLQTRNFFDDKPEYQQARLTLSHLQQALEFYELELDHVLEPKRKQLIEFRYLHPFVHDNTTYWLNHCGRDFSQHQKQLTHIGKVIETMLRETGCDLLFYTIDGIVDDQGRLWILEANSNPMMHPFVYQDMVRYLFKNSTNFKNATTQSI